MSYCARCQFGSCPRRMPFWKVFLFRSTDDETPMRECIRHPIVHSNTQNRLTMCNKHTKQKGKRQTLNHALQCHPRSTPSNQHPHPNRQRMSRFPKESDLAETGGKGTSILLYKHLFTHDALPLLTTTDDTLFHFNGFNLLLVTGFTSSSERNKHYREHSRITPTSVGTRLSMSEKLISNMFAYKATSVGADSILSTRALHTIPSFGASKLTENSFTGSLKGMSMSRNQHPCHNKDIMSTICGSARLSITLRYFPKRNSGLLSAVMFSAFTWWISM